MNNNYIRVNESIIESKTSNTVYVGQNSKMIYHHLNNGGGFCGFTPDFFLQKISRR